MDAAILENALVHLSGFRATFVLMDHHVNLTAIVGNLPEVGGPALKVARHIHGNPLRHRRSATHRQPSSGRCRKTIQSSLCLIPRAEAVDSGINDEIASC